MQVEVNLEEFVCRPTVAHCTLVYKDYTDHLRPPEIILQQ